MLDAFAAMLAEQPFEEIRITDLARRTRVAVTSIYARLEDQMLWVTGTDSLEAAIAFVRRLTLRAVAREITCPLIVHGGRDRQIPVDHG